MYEGDGTASSRKKEQPRWDRVWTVEKLASYSQAGPGLSQRRFAQENGVPRSTLQYWLSRKAGLDEDPLTRDFFESPQGLAFVHRLVAAAHLVFEQAGPCGVRRISLFLRLSRLDRVVAASVGSQHKVASGMEKLIVQYGTQERERLARDMPRRLISVCQDETFHPETCLVAIEPVSDFILLERYAERRDAPSWDEKMKEATADLNVQIVQAVSDEASGLLAHAHKGLGVHHGPDLFHVQHDLVKGTASALAASVRQAAEQLEEARGEVAEQMALREQYRSETHGPGRPPQFEKRMAEAQQAEQRAALALQEAEQRRAQCQEAIQAIGQSYHPFRLHDGQLRSSEELAAELKQHFEQIESIAAQAALPEGSVQRIAKARRLIGPMVSTLAFFFLQMRLLLGRLELQPHLARLVRHSLLPGLYLQRAAAKAPSAHLRAELRQKAEELLRPARAADGPLAALPQQEQRRIEEAVRCCIDLFVRSSSCVEGRNGQLALRHHSLHRLSERKLAVLTTIHNYFLRRSDGTTAAQRFFGSQPSDLFDWVLDRLEIPARPASRRSRENPVPA